MKHLKKGRKFGRKKGQRRAFLKTLAHNLALNEKILTTEARAKELKKFMDQLVGYGKKENIHGLRLLLKQLPKSSAYRIYHEIAPRYRDRLGGYTRITKCLKPRKSDGAKMAYIEFV